MAKQDWSLLIGKIATVYKDKGKKSGFADDLGISMTELNNKLNGKTNFSIAQAKKIQELLNLSEEETYLIFFQ